MFCELKTHAKFQKPMATPSGKKVTERREKEEIVKKPLIVATRFCLQRIHFHQKHFNKTDSIFVKICHQYTKLQLFCSKSGCLFLGLYQNEKVFLLNRIYVWICFFVYFLGDEQNICSAWPKSNLNTRIGLHSTHHNKLVSQKGLS